jgi:hypothetical protein
VTDVIPPSTDQDKTQFKGTRNVKNLLLGFLGALAGGVVGYFVFFWLARQGFYALVLPGALVGAGGSALTRDRSVPRGIGCAVVAIALGVFTEWRFAPFSADHSLSYFLAHIPQLRPITMLMIAAGGAFGWWLGLGYERPRRLREV